MESVLSLHPRSQLRLKLDQCLTCTIIVVSRTIFKLWHSMTVDLFMAYVLMLVSMTLTLMQGHNGSAKAKSKRWIISTIKQAIRIKLATTVCLFFLYDLDFENVYTPWPACILLVFWQRNTDLLYEVFLLQSIYSCNVCLVTHSSSLRFLSVQHQNSWLLEAKW